MNSTPDHGAAPSVRAPDRTAAVYARTGIRNPDRIAAQLAACREAAARDGWHIPDSLECQFVDDGCAAGRIPEDKSSRGARSSPGFSKLLHLITSGRAPFRRLYVAKRDRIGRTSDPRYIFWLEDELRRHGVDLRFASEAADFGPPASHDSADDGRAGPGFLINAMSTLLARAERAAIARRVREGVRLRVLNGFYVGRYAPYATERWLVDRATRAYIAPLSVGTPPVGTYAIGLRWVPRLRGSVRALFDALERGDTPADVAHALGTGGVEAPRGRGGWTPASVRRVAADPIYMGDLVFGRRAIAADGACAVAVAAVGDDPTGEHGPLYVRGFLPDAPISRAQFEAVQCALRARARG